MIVSKFLIERLENAGIKHVFGLPGDYVLDFYKELWDSKKIKVINNTDEAHAGFAADAYARVNGVGCVVLTYSVGASKAINAIQCAYAERSPLIIISGAPGISEREEPLLLNHMARHFNSQKKMFDEITCASVVLDNPVTAGYKIDWVLEALHHYKRPIYIELPRDVAKQAISYDVYKQGTPKAPVSDIENLQEAIAEVSKWIKEAKSPAILTGVEISRYKLNEQLVKFAERHDIPVATTLLSKSVINERHRLFAGLYFGEDSEEHTRKIVDESDCLMIFGDVNTDMNLFYHPVKFKKRQVIWANVEGLQVKNHTYSNIQYVDFCKTLFKVDLGKKELPEIPHKKEIEPFDPKKNKKITSERLFEKIDSILNQSHVVCADMGDALFGSGDLTVHSSHSFLSPAYYTSMGAAIPYALGVQTCMPAARPIVIVGDGAFQMSCSELSTLVQRNLNPIVFVLNNEGYATERFILDGGFNDIKQWNYHKISEMIGGKGGIVKTEEDLETIIEEALDSKELFVINVVLGKRDVSSGMKRMVEAMSRKNTKGA